ncbi:capsular polysaccharide biosynthesis protein [Bacillus oleivorans]|uniref:Capsular polysaccharide biosynthesis protein n=1 Tax=Bacillus oleivorans TaxID=1448271 RepID=A0A285CHJ8_9BACI|nr:Wzz/FepE/Etk N-terminal domain-containing protein [Bacillus oleivorans]SNX67072.1 capsular polysaccharide biosynthesis protein [Bacillus oleivorans]
MEETISLREIFETLKKRFLLIVSITLLATVASGVISYLFLTPIYQSSTQLLVNQERTDQPFLTASDIQSNLQLINTYSVIIKSPAILDGVIEELDLDLTTSQLNEKIQVQSEQNSQVVTLSVEDPDPSVAADIANTTAQIFREQIVILMNVDNVTILSEAIVSDNPVQPRPLLNIAIAFVVGLMAGVGIAFLLEYIDRTIKTEQDIEKILELPVLGVITTIDDEDFEELGMRAARKTETRGETIGA